jgi:phosphatidate cytidylyltransferase
MAFNWKTFQTRTLTAIIFAAVMLTGLLWNQWSILVLFSIIHFGCWWEYFNLLEKIHKTTYHRYTRIGFMLMGYAIMLWFYKPPFQIYFLYKYDFSFPVSVAGFVMLALGIFQTQRIKAKAFGIAALGFLYISLSCGLMMNFQSAWGINISLHENYVLDVGFLQIPIVIVASIWVNDTMAYIAGSLFGKTPLSKVSPKKTWEGTIGGIILSIVSVAFLFTIVFYPVQGGHFSFYLFYAGVAAISSIAGTFGDLLESKLKRMAGVKDSGSLMPGHGGFLDRFDSLLLATPAVWLFIYLLYSPFTPPLRM